MRNTVGTGREAPRAIHLIIISNIMFALAPIPACSRSETPPAAEAAAAPSGDESATVAHILALDPADESARVELAAIAGGSAEPSVRLLALRRLDAAGSDATSEILALARALLSESAESASPSPEQVRVNLIAALARREAESAEARSLLESHLASASEPWKAAALAVVASVRAEGGVR